MKPGALQEAMNKYGTYSGKVWNLQEDGSVLPADGGLPLSELKTCEHCKHWESSHSSWPKRCFVAGEFVEIWGFSEGGANFEPPADFGCNRFEAK